MRTNPLVSIITPSYNQGKFIKQTIDSVLNQDYKRIEYLVMDGGSTDETVAILKSYGKKLKWFSKKDKGQMDALNQGLKLVKGDIIAFINSDDYYPKDAIKKIVNLFQNNKEIEIISGDYMIVNENSVRIQNSVGWWKKVLRKIAGFNTLCIANYINQPSTFWRRSVYEKLGDFNEELHLVFDYEYWLKAFQKKIKMMLVDDVLSCYRVHSESKGGSQYKKRSAEELKVQKEFNSNPIIYGLHLIHNQIMILIYSFIQ